MVKKDYIFLSIILVLALFFRLYQIQIVAKSVTLVKTYDNPLADLHSWRQADTAAVARNYVKDGIDLLRPRYDDLSDRQSGIENPVGLRYVEFPIYNATFAWLYSTFPVLSLDAYGRITTAFFSLLIIAVIYYLCLHEENRIAAIVASGVYAVFPFFVFFSRVILPETTALSFMMLSVFFLYLFTRKEDQDFAPIYFVLSAICLALSVLAKPTTIFYSFSLFYLLVLRYKWSVLKKFQLYLFFILGFIPLVAWRYFISFHPEAIPASSWLITGVNTYEGLKNIFFKPAFFRWIFYERISNIVFGGYLLFLFVLGTIAKPKKYLLHTIFISAFVYLFTFQGGNVQHEYYQTIILPGLAVMVGLGASFIQKNESKFFHPFFVSVALIVVFAFSYFFSYYRVQEFYHYPNDLVTIANVVKSLTNEDDKIITDRLGDTTLLYLCNRKGSPAKYMELEDFKKMGYSYFVTQNIDTIKNTEDMKKFTTVYKNDKFALFKL